ncbi:MAG: hypothetical protein L0177_14065 [Chloroflexi bacterium]|nr:hypothetical protein [Chloroflexota bacterium]
MSLKILVYMPKWQHGFETRLFGVARALRSRGYVVDFRMAAPGLLREGHAFMPCVPDELFQRTDFQEVEARPISSLGAFYRAALAADIIMTGNSLKGMKHIESIIRQMGKPYIICDDTGDIILSSYCADIVAVPGEVHREFLSANGLVPAERIVVTGPLHLNVARSPEHNPSWDSFCEKYGLDRGKKIALICTSAAQGQSDWTKQYQQRIVGCVEQSSQFQPLLRVHPNDTAGHKRQFAWSDTSKDSAEQLYPHVPKIVPDDRVAAMNLSNLLITIQSMTVMETSLFNMNGLMTGNLEQWLYPQYLEREPLPSKRHKQFGLAKLERTSLIDRLLEERKLRLYGLFWGRFAHEFPLTWIGSVCSGDELPELLDSEEILSVDEKERERHLAYYWHSDDGLAHERVADAVEMAQDIPALSRKLYQSRGRRLWQLSSYGLWRAVQPVTAPNTPIRNALRRVARRVRARSAA